MHASGVRCAAGVMRRQPPDPPEPPLLPAPPAPPVSPPALAVELAELAPPTATVPHAEPELSVAAELAASSSHPAALPNAAKVKSSNVFVCGFMFLHHCP